eukprot:NODE_146_length_17563_cov_0.253321.p9 type:complete len:115 gc:universal NODE_146_length_17563_cov_0.253321:12687-13031(+)
MHAANTELSGHILNLKLIRILNIWVKIHISTQLSREIFDTFKFHMQRNSTNSGRAKVEQLVECEYVPTLVYYSDGSIAVQHPIVYSLMLPLFPNSQDTSDFDDPSLKSIGLDGK